MSEARPNKEKWWRVRAFFNQPIFYYMLSSTLIRLHNNIYLKKFHADGMAFQMS
jgi:hypothetical protein